MSAGIIYRKDCLLPSATPNGKKQNLLDITPLSPGSILPPSQNWDTLTKPHRAKGKHSINWLFYKGALFTGGAEEPGHPEAEFIEWWQKPRSTADFTLDLMREGSEEVVRNVMKPTTIDSFWESLVDKKFIPNRWFKLGIYSFSQAPEPDYEPNLSCPFYEFGLATFYWDIPASLDRKPLYQMRLTATGASSSPAANFKRDLVFLSEPFSLPANGGGIGWAAVMGFLFGLVFLAVCGLWVFRWVGERRRLGRVKADLGLWEDAYVDEELDLDASEEVDGERAVVVTNVVV